VALDGFRSQRKDLNREEVNIKIEGGEIEKETEKEKGLPPPSPSHPSVSSSSSCSDEEDSSNDPMET